MSSFALLFRWVKTLRTAVLSLLSLVTFGAIAGPTRDLQAVVFQGREALLYRAQSADGIAAPLVVVLHGGFQSGEKMAESLPLAKLAEKGGFNVIYPTGVPLRLKRSGPLISRNGGMNGWNAGLAGHGMLDTSVQDVAYLEALIRSLVRKGIADPDRVTVVGHSNGAMMAYRLVCERPGLVQSVVAVAGTPAIAACTRDLTGLRILHVHGSRDENQPAQGGIGPKGVSQHHARSVAETVRMMQAAGAGITVHLVDGGGHRLDELNRPARQQFGADIPGLVSQMVAQSAGQPRALAMPAR